MQGIFYNEKFKEIKDKLVLYSFVALCCMSMLYDSTLIITDPVSKAVINFLIYTVIYFILANLIVDVVFYKNEYTLFAIMLFMLSVLVLRYSGDNSFLLCVMFMITMSKYRFDDIAKKSVYPLFATFFLIIFLSSLNIIPDFIYGRGDGTYRYSLGFYYPTIVSSAYMFLILIRIYVKKFSLSWLELISHVGVSVALYVLTDSRTGFLLCAAALILCVAYKLFFRKHKFEKLINLRAVKLLTTALPFISCSLFLLLVLLYFYGFEFAVIADGFLSGRLYYTVNGFDQFPISLFGTTIYMNGWGGYGYVTAAVDNYNYNYVDNGYMQIFFKFGISSMIAILIVYTLIMHQAVKEKNHNFIIVFIIILINCVIEPNLLLYSRNIFVLYASSFLYKKIDRMSLSARYGHTITERSKRYYIPYNVYTLIKTG